MAGKCITVTVVWCSSQAICNSGVGNRTKEPNRTPTYPFFIFVIVNTMIEFQYNFTKDILNKNNFDQNGVFCRKVCTAFSLKSIYLMFSRNLIFHVCFPIIIIIHNVVLIHISHVVDRPRIHYHYFFTASSSVRLLNHPSGIGILQVQQIFVPKIIIIRHYHLQLLLREAERGARSPTCS